MSGAVGRCALGGMQSCSGGIWSTCSGNLPITEDCTNAIDDDCDGVVNNGCAAQCTVANAATTCNDNNACTTDSCSGATCAHSSITCNTPPNTLCYNTGAVTCNNPSTGCDYTSKKKTTGTSCGNNLVCDSNGQCVSTSINCNLNPAATPQINLPTTAATGSTITYSSSGFSSYSWTLGNEQSSSTASGSTSYASAGEITVSLIVIDSRGCTGMNSKKITITKISNCGDGITDSGEVCDGPNCQDDCKACIDGWEVKNGLCFKTDNGCKTNNDCAAFGTQKICSATGDCVQCLVSTDCAADYECKSNSCAKKPVITEEKTPLGMTVSSPQNREYSTTEVLLLFETTKESSCSYKLNNANSIQLGKSNSGQAALNPKEGANTLTVECAAEQETKTSTIQFTIKKKTTTTIADDLKGKPKESLLDSLKDKSQVAEQKPKDMVDTLSKYLPPTISKAVQKDGEGSLLSFAIKNPRLTSLKNTTITLTIPKTVAQSSDELSSEDQFLTINPDPIIAFLLGDIQRQEEKTITLNINKPVSQEMLDSIGINIEEDKDGTLQKSLATADASSLKIRSSYDKDSDTTTITTTIIPKKALNGYSFIQKIPKCLAEQIDSLDFSEDTKAALKVLESDPVVMWNFDTVDKPQEITYRIKGILSEECRKRIENMGIADTFGIDLEQSTPLSKMLIPLLAIPLIGAIVVYLGKFHPSEDKKEKERAMRELKKEEVQIRPQEPPQTEQRAQAQKETTRQPEIPFEDKLKQQIAKEEEEMKKWFGK